MIAIDRTNSKESRWQNQFVSMLPEIERRFNSAFRELNPTSKEEAIGEGMLHALIAYWRLHRKNREHVATAASLVFYSARAVRRGRPAAGRMNGYDILSRYAQVGHGVQVDSSKGEWIDTLVADRRASVPDQVAFKLDFASWFATLTNRMKEIATDLAFGWSTAELAKKNGVTAARISQLRRVLEQSWATFQETTC